MSIAIKCWVDEILFKFMQWNFKDCQLEPLPVTYIARANAEPFSLVCFILCENNVSLSGTFLSLVSGSSSFLPLKHKPRKSTHLKYLLHILTSHCRNVSWTQFSHCEIMTQHSSLLHFRVVELIVLNLQNLVWVHYVYVNIPKLIFL